MKYNFSVKYGDNPQQYLREWRAANLERKREADRVWRLNNKDHSAEVNRQWRLRNPDKRSAIVRRYYQRHRDAILRKQKGRDRTEQMQRHYQKNKAKVAARNKSWRIRNPQFRIANAAARRTRDQMFKDVSEWIRTIKKMESVKCFYCETRITGRQCHIDHFISVRNGGKTTRDNLVVACPKCNRRKSGKNGNDFKTGQLVLLV